MGRSMQFQRLFKKYEEIMKPFTVKKAAFFSEKKKKVCEVNFFPLYWTGDLSGVCPVCVLCVY